MLHRFCFTILAATAIFTAPALADCKSEIQSVLQSMESSGPYHLDMTSESNGTTMTMSGDVILPHSVHIKSSDMEMLMTPNGVWMAQNGALQKMPNEMKENVASMIKQAISIGVKAVESAECLGSSNFEDGTYTHYKYDGSADFMGIATKSTVDMYVDGNNKPRWMLVDGEAMGQKSKTKQHIVFDDGIVIAEPKAP